VVWGWRGPGRCCDKLANDGGLAKYGVATVAEVEWRRCPA
jgi:hypothetical protein